MTNRPASAQTTRLVCPTCGTRIGTTTRRCVVCGADLMKPGPDPTAPRRSAALAKFRALMPVGIVVGLVGLSCVFLLGALGVVPLPELPTRVPSATPTGTETLTPTPTFTPSATPTPTPLPPIEYVIKPGDSILALAIQYDVAPWSINDLNRLQPDSVLSVGMKLLIPHPSATPPPAPTSTPSPTDTPGP